MLRVRIELVPYGIESEAKQIGEMVIANVANLGLGMAAYDAVLQTDRSGEDYYVKGLKHSRQSGFWELIHKLLHEDVMIEMPTNHDDLPLFIDQLQKKVKMDGVKRSD